MNTKHLIKTVVLRGARRLGVNQCARRILRSRVLVLCYHAVISDHLPRDPYRTRVAIRVSAFRRQLRILRRLFHPISPDELLHHLIDGAELPPSPVLVTFDDGHRNNSIFAAPELEELRIPAVIHLATGHIGEDGLLWPYELDERVLGWKRGRLPMPGSRPDVLLPEDASVRRRVAHGLQRICCRLSKPERDAYLGRLRQEPLPALADWQRELYAFLSWDEVEKLAEQGLCIGSHTVSHPVLTSLSSQELAEELRTSKSQIEACTGQTCWWLAYPHGGPRAFSPKVVAAVREAGYKVAFSLMDRPNPSRLQPLRVDRICMVSGLSEDDFQARLHGLRSLLAMARGPSNGRPEDEPDH